MDFTIKKYKKLLENLKETGYSFQTFSDFLQNPAEKVIVLRHDVDAKKMNSLRFAKIQAANEIRGTYFFRAGNRSFDRRIMREMAAMGHEIGYHYETMDTARGDVDKAYEHFNKNLVAFRKIIPVKTICMHGSPLSKYDNRGLWDKYDYKELDIIGEPYLDIDFNKVLYLTDTGRRWDGDKVSIRDKVKTGERTTNNEQRTVPSPPVPHLPYRSTNDIIKAAKAGKLPDQIMLTFHPQRWTNKPFPWIKELIWQNMKNQIKKILVKRTG